jgi:hypothetical protein
MTLTVHNAEIIVKHNKFEQTFMSYGRIFGQAIAQVAVAALCIRMSRFLLYLFAGHYELGVAEASHSFPVRVAQNAFVARLIAGIKVDEEQNDDELGYDDRDACSATEKFPKFADCHDIPRLPQANAQNN